MMPQNTVSIIALIAGLVIMGISLFGNWKTPEFKDITPEEPVIRQVDANHISFIRQLNRALLPVNYTDWTYRHILDNPEYSLVISHRNVQVGATTGLLIPVSKSEWEYRPDPSRINATFFDEYHLNVVTLGVLPTYRRQGFGSILFDAIIQKVMEDNRNQMEKDLPQLISGILLHVHSENHVAINFYRKHGFESTNFIENYYSGLESPSAYLFTRQMI
jgi:N-alpha-acetyltransferase 50